MDLCYTFAMNRKEYERLKAEAQAEYRRKLEAIETVWRMTDGKNENGFGGSWKEAHYRGL